MIYILLSLLFLIIIAFLTYFFYYNNILNNNNLANFTENNEHIYFMSYKETSEFLTNDNDRYVRNFSELDLHARNVKTYMEYISNIEDTTISFTEEEKRLLIKCANNANKYFKTETYKELKYGKHINGDDIANIKWIFANTYTNHFNNVIKEYEEGLPHTRENIIFVSKNVLKYDELNLTNTLIHEKIHIYQRYNSKLFDKIIREMGLLELDIKSFKYAKYIRSNPDTTNKIYYDNSNINNSKDGIIESDNNNVMVYLYRNDNPNGINDVIQNNYSKEHPYEKIAYEIAENFYKNNKNKYINI
jgi:hypothetical protein